MAKKLFVGNLPFSATESTLRDFFAKAGNVESATIITDKMSGRAKGFGFVEMATEEEAQNAINTLNGAEMEGRQISVAEARPMEDRPPRRSFDRDGGRGGFGGGRGGNRGGFGGGGRRF